MPGNVKGQLPNIPERLHGAVMERVADGKTSDEIAAWLSADEGIDLNPRTVRRFIARRRSERADVAKVVLREKLGKSIVADVDRLESMANGLYEQAAMHLDRLADDDFEDEREAAWVERRAAEMCEQARKILETKLKFSGAEQPDSPANGGGIRIWLPPEET